MNVDYKHFVLLGKNEICLEVMSGKFECFCVLYKSVINMNAQKKKSNDTID